MKMKQLFVLAVALCTLHSVLSTAEAQATAFTYQGQLMDVGVPATGLYDFQFALFNAPSGGRQVGSTTAQTAIAVTNGLFTTALDFGAVFTGNATWLAISVCSNGVGNYVLLSPLQQIVPTPYALYAPNAGVAANVSGAVAFSQLPSTLITNNAASATLNNLTVSGALTLNSPIVGVLNGNGGGLTNLNASQFSSGVVPTSVLPGFQSSDNYATVGGGAGNTAGAAYATVAGGGLNTNTGNYATIGGGNKNEASNICATVPGGFNNIAGGQYSFAAGQQAQALHEGAFVWADSQNAPFASDRNDEFLIRAQGGVRITGIVYANGVQLTSDRNAKENFATLDSQRILAEVAALPLTEWNYKNDAAGIRHLGPMAQDFQAAFQLNGGDDKHISVVDESGVALAAIQGLNEKLEQQRKEKDAEIQALKQSVAELKQIVQSLAERK